jgi:N-acetylglucosamine-6-phosphate deacetylase
MIAYTARELYTPLEKIDQPILLVEDGLIARISSRSEREIPPSARVLDFGASILAPGFLDVHLHGGAGHDVMNHDPDKEGSMQMALAAHGVTAYLATTVTAPLDRTLAALEGMAASIEKAGNGEMPDIHRARPLGIHLEGPFISHVRRGVHPPENLLLPTIELFDRFWQAARGHILMMTIAPELDGAFDVIAEANRRGVCVSVGHSDADLPTTQRAIAAGARHATHTFNAMRPLSHRDPGVIGAVLTDNRVSADIIADGIHLDPAIVQLFLRAKGVENAVLITDAIAATGMPDGRYQLGGIEVEVKAGQCTADGKLAGSVLTLDRAIRNVMEFAQWDLQKALRLATVNPARTIRNTTCGSLKAGAAADFVVLSPAGDVMKTVIRGNVA